jgi:hypothetical protein
MGPVCDFRGRLRKHLVLRKFSVLSSITSESTDLLDLQVALSECQLILERKGDVDRERPGMRVTVRGTPNSMKPPHVAAAEREGCQNGLPIRLPFRGRARR